MVGINSYRFFFSNFGEKLYAFQRDNLLDNSVNINIWESSDAGINWSKKKSIPCSLNTDNASCDIVSSIIVDNELTLIYGNNSQQAIAKSVDGSKWDTVSSGNSGPKNVKKIIYYSGHPFDFSNTDNDKQKYIMCYNTTEGPDKNDDDDVNNITVAACSVSYDQGKSWKVSSYLRVKKSIGNISPLDQLFYSKKNVYFVATIDSQRHNLFACAVVKENEQVFHCEIMKDSITDEATLLINMNTIKNSLVYISIFSDRYTLNLIKEDFLIEDAWLDEENDEESDVDISDRIFHIIFVNESLLSILYEENAHIYVIHAEIRKRKAGCQYNPYSQSDTKWHQISDEYTDAFSTPFVSGPSSCYLRSFELAEDEDYVRFFVKVPVFIDFENNQNCFRHTPFTSYHESYGSVSIKIKNIKLLHQENEYEMKEIEFYYPVSIHKIIAPMNIFFCYSVDGKYDIMYAVPHGLQRINFFNFHKVGPYFSTDENRLALNNYVWNSADVEIPRGSYILNPTYYISRFELYKNIMDGQIYALNMFPKFNHEFNIRILFPEEQVTYNYAGIDLTDSSPYYDINRSHIIEEDEIITINVKIPEKGKFIGLVCPLENEDALGDLICFDDVIDLHNNIVPFELVFPKFSFFVAPKRVLYNKKLIAVESLLHLGKESYDDLAKMDTPITFGCICRVNNHTVTITFVVEAIPRPSVPNTNPLRQTTQVNNNNVIINRIITPDVTDTHSQDHPHTQNLFEASQRNEGGSTHTIFSLAFICLYYVILLHI